ncbi:MAG: MMPL family transporter [Nitrospirota bacterium]
MKLAGNIVQYSINRPGTITIVMVVITIMLGAMISLVQVDTDPENMLADHEPVRVFHDQAKKDFNLHDVVILGVVNETHPDGVFNIETLGRVHELTGFIRGLQKPDRPEWQVVTSDLMAPGNVDIIEQAGPGQIRFKWLMKQPPETREQALKVRDNAMSNPLLKGTLVSEDGKALGIYIPITSKDFAYFVRERLLEKIGSFEGSSDDQYHITGLPVAEDTFGVEMFVQMALSAPLAMLAIFILMLIFFRKPGLIISPIIVAMVSVICTMGLLIVTGNTLHIMSSMIPIFLMPIAVVDGIHILSEFFDTYRQTSNRRKTIEGVMEELFMPMMYTSLTSAAGFASLALTPIPPVRVFGIFVAFGIILAWLLTILFIPAYIMMLSEKQLAGLGHSGGEKETLLSRHLKWVGNVTHARSKLVLAVTALTLIIAIYGINKIQINDNPVKWFKKSHPIRLADKVLNHHFGGTYEAYLILQEMPKKETLSGITELVLNEVKAGIEAKENPDLYGQAAALIQWSSSSVSGIEEFWEQLIDRWNKKLDNADDASYDFWADTLDRIEAVKNRGQIFKRPDVLEYVSGIQEHLLNSDVVGKSNSVADLVKKVYQELFEGDPRNYKIPETVPAVAQTLISFQNSHKPDDLWHLVTPDYKKANIWLQLKSGDNRDMERVVQTIDKYLDKNPAPVPLKADWAGLTYLNIVWQDKMVWGMLKSFLSSFAVVFIMMTILFRSPFWGILAMIPLSVTIALIYGIIGVAGKDYDMPVAVLSSLTLGLAVDFAIHFLERSRMLYKKYGSWEKVIVEMFEEPARAITRNVIVIAIGFTPLLAASLVPYNTVGIFLASIMAISGMATMYILPSLIKIMERQLFRKLKKE